MGYDSYDTPTRIQEFAHCSISAAKERIVEEAHKEVATHRRELASALWVLADNSTYSLSKETKAGLRHQLVKTLEIVAKLRSCLTPYTKETEALLNEFHERFLVPPEGQE